MSLTKALERDEKRQDQEHQKKVLESLDDLRKTLEDKDFTPQINVEAPVIPPIPPVEVKIPPQEPVKVEVTVDAPKIVEVPVIRELNVKNPDDIAKEILDEVKDRITRKDPLPTIMVDEEGVPIKFTEKDSKTNKPLWRGGGSQYGAGNAVDSSVRGNVILFDDGGTLRIPSDTYKLPVEATFTTGDIEIGAVELKNATSDDRVAVINTAPTTEFGVVTRNIPSGTQAISAASLPLPSGAATSANQLPDGHNVTIDNTVTDPVNVSLDVQKDIFGHLIISQQYNQIEMRLDKSDWADFVTETNVNGGDTTQSGGMANISTSTATNGSAILSSVDTMEYRPGAGIFGAGTAIFTTGVTGSIQYVGMGTDTTFTNGVAFGYKGTSFGIRYTRGGSEVSFTAQADWDDPCLGGAGSLFTRDGVLEALDPAKNNLYRIEAGLFGFAGWKAQVWSPDNGWITVLTYKHINTGTVPVFTSNSFKLVLNATKTSGATDIVIKSQCWGGGTGHAFGRILDQSISDRTLAQTTRSVLTAKKPDATYTNINATAGGNLKVSVQEISDGLDIGAGNAGSETQRVSISTDDVNLSAIKTAVETLDNAISGTEMQVDVVGALPVGTNSIGAVTQATHDNFNANANIQIGNADASVSNPVPISLAVSMIGDGRKTITSAGTAETLVGSTLPAKYAIITSETDNTGVIVVGTSTVVAALGTRRGTPLFPGDSTTVPCDDLVEIYLDTTVSGDGVTFTYFA